MPLPFSPSSLAPLPAPHWLIVVLTSTWNGTSFSCFGARTLLAVPGDLHNIFESLRNGFRPRWWLFLGRGSLLVLYRNRCVPPLGQVGRPDTLELSFPQFVVAGLIALNDLFDCDDELLFLTTTTLEATIGCPGPSSTCTVKALRLISLAVTVVPF